MRNNRSAMRGRELGTKFGHGAVAVLPTRGFGSRENEPVSLWSGSQLVDNVASWAWF
jgi:hypothetical protein